MANKYIISLGGSLISTANGVDVDYLKKFKQLILAQLKLKKKFIIVCGGGKLCREYNKAASTISQANSRSLDWLGISATHLNANLIKTVFGHMAFEKIIINPNILARTAKPIIVAGGWKPGWSTDYDACLLAKKYKIKNIINLTNVDYVFDKDPEKFKDAKKIESIGWEDFRKIVGNKWQPGKNAPFDPVASRLAQKLKLKVRIINGKNIKNLQNCLDGKNIIGTTIS